MQTVRFTLAVGDIGSGSGSGRGRPVGSGDGEEDVEPDELAEPDEKPQFSDVKESDWFYEAVTMMAKKDILSGMGDGTFRPLEDVKRADFLIMIMRQFDLAPEANETREDNFLDAGQTYYTPYLAKAKALGIASGVGDNLFAPEARSFTDFDEVADYSKEPVRILSAMGVVNGSESKVMPKDFSKRCEAAGNETTEKPTVGLVKGTGTGQLEADVNA